MQTDKFGTSVGAGAPHACRDSPSKRRQRAEERAQKIGVKLVFPLVLFFFPAFYVVILGSADYPFMRDSCTRGIGFPALTRKGLMIMTTTQMILAGLTGRPGPLLDAAARAVSRRTSRCDRLARAHTRDEGFRARSSRFVRQPACSSHRLGLAAPPGRPQPAVHPPGPAGSRDRARSRRRKRPRNRRSCRKPRWSSSSGRYGR